jgi:hypothetical protein
MRIDTPEDAELSFASEVTFELLPDASRRSRRAPVCTDTTLMREGSIWRSVAKLKMKFVLSNCATGVERVRESCTT